MVKIYIPKPQQKCNVRDKSGRICGEASTYEEFRKLVHSLSPVPIQILVSERSWLAIDPDTDSCLFYTFFKDNV